MDELDTLYEEQVTCPWCGHEETDSWKFKDGVYECSECDKPFEVYRHVSVDYSTYRVIKEEKRNG